MPENQDNYKLLLEWLVKGFVKLAPILIGFLGMSAFDSLRKGETKEPLSTRVVNLILRFGVALTVSAGVYQILPLWPELEPFTGVIIGFCSAFSLTIMTVLVNNLPEMLTEFLKSALGIAQKKLNKNDNDHP
jgi:hypothetical protein